MTGTLMHLDSLDKSYFPLQRTGILVLSLLCLVNVNHTLVTISPY